MTEIEKKIRSTKILFFLVLEGDDLDLLICDMKFFVYVIKKCDIKGTNGQRNVILGNYTSI